MKRDDLIEALNGISEENLLEGIALAETAALPAKTSKRRIARISLQGLQSFLPYPPSPAVFC